MTDYQNEIISTLRNEADENPFHVGIVLGSGLGSLTDNMEIEGEIDYKDIANFPQSTVEGHSGKFIYGMLGGKRVITAKGRFHYYEGYGIPEVLAIVTLFHYLKVKNAIVTNAAGLMNTEYKEGEIILIEDCIDFTFQAEKSGSLDMAKIRKMEVEKAKLASEKSGLFIGQGKYVWTTGPSYETPSEIDYMKKHGGDVVGMSTMPEIIWAREHGMNVFPFSCATNFAAGISKNKLSHEEVNETANRIKNEFSNYISTLVSVI